MKSKFLYFLLVIVGMSFAVKIEAAPKFLKMNKPLMDSMLANTTSFDNELNILKAKKEMQPLTLTVGGYLQGGFTSAQANASTFFYSDDLTFKSRNYFSLDRVALALLPNFTDWASLYFEAGATDICQSYSSKLQVNQMYALLGDGEFPLYGFAGYKNIDFGKFKTVNIFAQPITRWDFAGTALTAGIGYLAHGLNVTFSAFPKGSQGREDYYGAGLWKVHNYTNYYSTNAPNFAINTSYLKSIDSVDWNIGAGYVRGLWLGDPGNFFHKANIGAWDLNSQIYYKGLTFLVEYVQSIPKTSSFGAFIPVKDNNVFLQNWDVGVSYQWKDFLLPRESTISADVSGVIGNSSFAQAIQTVVGFSNNFIRNINAGIEYVFISQTSNEQANRSGIFYRDHHNLQAVRLDLTGSF